MKLNFWSRGYETFKLKKDHQQGTKRQELHNFAQATLGSGNLQNAVKLPEGEDLNEWIAVHTVDFFNQVGLLYYSIAEFCTDTTCEVMSAGPKYEYMWMDGVDIKKPIRVSARQYVDYLMKWIEGLLNDDTIFPTRSDVPFPRNFQSIIKNIFKRMFRVYAHIYYSHFKRIVALGEEAHLNTCFKHFFYFITEFDLVEKREMAPLQDLIDSLISKDKDRAAKGSGEAAAATITSGSGSSSATAPTAGATTTTTTATSSATTPTATTTSTTTTSASGGTGTPPVTTGKK